MSDIGQITIVTTNGFWGWVIRHVTESTSNHNTIIVSETHQVSAEPGGVRLVPRTDYPTAVVADYPLTDEQRDAIVAFAMAQIDKPYGYWTDFWIGVGLIFRTHTPRWIERMLSDGGTWECAQLCDAAYIAADINLFEDNRPDGAVYPGSLEKLFKRKGWIK